MAETQQQKANRDRDYVLGRIKVPREVLSLDSRFFVYAADTGQNATGTLSNGQISNGGAATVQVQIDDSSYFLVEAIQIVSGLQTVLMDTATVQITDTTTARAWSDQAVPLRDIGGKGDSPKYLSDPQLLRPTATVNVQITNNTGSAAAFYVAFIGRKIYGMTEDLANLMLRRLWFQYVINYSSGLAASAVGTVGQAKIYNESDFLVKRFLSSQLIGNVLGLTGGAQSNEVLMQIKDTSGDRNYANQYFNARLLIGQLAGEVTSVANSWSNGMPLNMLKPLLVRRNAILEVDLTNLSTTAISSAFNIVAEGCRIFDAA